MVVIAAGDRPRMRTWLPTLLVFLGLTVIACLLLGHALGAGLIILWGKTGIWPFRRIKLERQRRRALAAMEIQRG